MPRQKTSQELIDAKREQLINAAIRVFADKGFHQAKMQDIAIAADVGKGTIYEYFATKDELFLAVYDSWMDEYEKAMEAAMEDHIDPVTKADALIDTTVDFYEKHASEASILLEFWAHAIRSNDEHFLERIRRMKQKLTAMGREITSQMKKLKLFSEVEEESFALLELGISDGIFLQWILDGQSYSLRKAYKFRQSVIGTGLMTPALRTLVSVKTDKRLRAGFLDQDK
jgi:TetR/AcrR family fatty acid metabolism transcriptional regulator